MFDPCDVVFAVLHVILAMLKWMIFLSLLYALLFGRACSAKMPAHAASAIRYIGGDVPAGGR